MHPGTDETITADNLFSDENIRRLFTDMAETFADFPPLGLVLVVILGIGVADKTGLISAALKSFVASVPNTLLTAALVFAGIMSSLAVEALIESIVARSVVPELCERSRSVSTER